MTDNGNGKRKVIVAEHAGFCFGVQRAIDMALECASGDNKRTYSYGPLIHNETVINDLKNKGIEAVDACMDDSIDGKGKTVIIRAHGVSYEEEQYLRHKYDRVMDATCPFVKKIHNIVEEHSKAGEVIVITGSPSHPEVLGIQGHISGRFFVISTEEEALNLDLKSSDRVCVVSQTTFLVNKFKDFVEIIRQKVYDVHAYNTICNATEERQAEAQRLAQQVDVMLVLGGENSSNSKKLYEICNTWCSETLFLQDSQGLDLSALPSFVSIGITAGASTPHYIIEEVQKKCLK